MNTGRGLDALMNYLFSPGREIGRPCPRSIRTRRLNAPQGADPHGKDDHRMRHMVPGRD